MSTIKTTIDIGATPEIVWGVLTNFSAYPKWNPFIREAHGKAEKGKRIKLRVRFTPKRSHRLISRIIKVMPARELHWRDRFLVPGIFDAVHAFIIVPNGVHGVHFIQRQHYSGLLAPLIMPFIKNKTVDAFERMNASLKKVAEANANAGS